MTHKIDELFIKIGLEWLVKGIKPKFFEDYTEDILGNNGNNITVKFSYLTDKNKKYKVEIDGILCSCKGEVKRNKCDCCVRIFKIEKKKIRSEIKKRIRSKYPKETEYLVS